MRIIGIDYGDSRVGVAVSDPLGITAQGIATLPNKVYDRMIEALTGLIEQYGVDTIVIGMPSNMNGTRGVRCEVTEKFGDHLAEIFPEKKIVYWDERLSTVQAVSVLNETNTRGKGRKKVLDTVAACIILDSYLNFLKNKKEIDNGR